MVQFCLVKELKQKINIYSSETIFLFCKQFLNEYSLKFYNLEKSFSKTNKNELNLIFHSSDLYKNNINIKTLNNNFIVLTNSSNESIKTKIKCIYLKLPITVDQIKSEVSKFFYSKKIIFEGLSITDKKLTNTNNSMFCYLTDIEKDILILLIKNKNCKKNIIKKSILKINSSIESNSLESHLTRIRKKFEQINTKVKITAKNDVLYIRL